MSSPAERYLLAHHQITHTASLLYHLLDTHQWSRLSQPCPNITNTNTNTITSTADAAPSTITANETTVQTLSEVFAPSFTLDYTSMFGGHPRTVTPGEVVAGWRPLMESMDGGGGGRTWHMTGSWIVEGRDRLIGRDDGATAQQEDGEQVGVGEVTASTHVTAHLSKGGKRASNGGILCLRLRRLRGEECGGGGGKSVEGEMANRWRVVGMKVDMRWYEGEVGAVLGDVVSLE